MTAATLPGDGGRGLPRRRVFTDLPLLLTDALLVAASYLVALVLRFDGSVPQQYWTQLPLVLCVALAVHVVLNLRLELYGPLWLQAGAGEAWRLVVASSAATAVMGMLVLSTGPERIVPLSVPVNAGAFTVLLLGGTRFSARIWAARSRSRVSGGSRVVVVGEPVRVRPVLAQMASGLDGLVAAAVVTDLPSTWGRTLSDVPVCGPVADLGQFVRRHAADQVLLVPSGSEMDGVRAGLVAELAHEAGVPLRVLPPLHEIPGRRPRLRDIRPASIADLLGREPVDVDEVRVRRTIEGRCVIITGAGGSIGSEIASQVSALSPAHLILLDHDETHLHDAMAGLRGPGRSVLGDIRDEVFVDQLFADARPDVVFHAAAHKHVPILEDFPSEAVRTNVIGTDVLVRAAARHGAGVFVGISTDKAVNPRSVMGASKRLAEQLVVHRSVGASRFCCVRFGNVLGSRGSVVPTFLRQVSEGGPLTVTHPDMTRFFMTTREAVQLVLQAAATCSGGEIFMLDMGEPVRIVDLAERIIALHASRSEDNVRIEYTGLRPGEKMSEQLASTQELVEPTSHKKIHRVVSPLIPARVLLHAVDELGRRVAERDEQQTRELLMRTAGLPHVVDLTDRGLRSGVPVQRAGRPVLKGDNEEAVSS